LGLSLLFLVSLNHIHGHHLLIHFVVTLHHQFFESQVVVDGQNLVNNLLVHWVLSSLLARLHKLLVSDAQVSHELLEEPLHHFLEFLSESQTRRDTYIVDGGEF
jgi:hypothetical protein